MNWLEMRICGLRLPACVRMEVFNNRRQQVSAVADTIGGTMFRLRCSVHLAERSDRIVLPAMQLPEFPAVADYAASSAGVLW